MNCTSRFWPAHYKASAGNWRFLRFAAQPYSNGKSVTGNNKPRKLAFPGFGFAFGIVNNDTVGAVLRKQGA